MVTVVGSSAAMKSNQTMVSAGDGASPLYDLILLERFLYNRNDATASVLLERNRILRQELRAERARNAMLVQELHELRRQRDAAVFDNRTLRSVK